MKTGKTLQQLAEELTRRQALKKDYVVDTEQLYLHTDGERLESAGRVLATATTPHAHGQVSTWSGIPKRYYDKMLDEDAALLSINVNRWLRDTERHTPRMIRTLDGTFRAFLSDRYRRIDNEQIAQAALEPMLEMADRQELRVVSCDVTDQKLYIQAIFPRLEGEVKVGDAVQAGIIIRNSEIGAGALDIRPLLYRLVCLNGMVVPDDINQAKLRRSHVGRRVEAQEDFSIYTDETVQSDDRALMLKIRDTVTAMTDPERFDSILGRMKQAASSAEVANPSEAVAAVTQALQLPDSRRVPILEALIRGADYTQWGMANAITQQAHAAEDYDTSVELEQLGGQVITLDPSQWQRIAEAA